MPTVHGEKTLAHLPRIPERDIIKAPVVRFPGSSPTFVVGLDLFLWSRCLQFCGFAGYILWLT